MKNLAVLVPCFDRLEILEECLANLRLNREFDQGTQLVLAVDNAGDEVWTAIKRMLSSGLFVPFPRCEVQYSKTRLYSDRNIIRAINSTFADPGIQFVLRLDADVIVSPYFIRTLMAAWQWANHGYGNHVIGSSITCVGNLALKQLWNRGMDHNYPTGTNLLMSADQWQRISGLMLEYDRKYLDVPPLRRNNDDIRSWQRNLMTPVPKYPEYHWDYYFAEYAGTAHDGMTQVAIAQSGIRAAFTTVNRAILKGNLGENMTPEQYEAFRNVKLDILESDKHRLEIDFFWKNP